MQEITEVECLANIHWHGREPEEITRPLIKYSIDAGTDVLGPQPNTDKGLLMAHQVIDYTEVAKELVPTGKVMRFVPFIMITENTTEKMIDDCVKRGIVNGKGYPLNRTTKSQNGVEHHGRILPIVKHCGRVGMKYHQHPEHASMLFTNRDAEFAFLPVAQMYLEETDVIFFWEHGTDARCIPHWEHFAKKFPGRFFVTLTAHHLATNEDETFGDVRAVCKPPIKTEQDRCGLVQLVDKNYPWVMGCLDDAFHGEHKKHVKSGRCQCGAFTTPFGLCLYAHALKHLFQTRQKVETFINFTSRNARRVHYLPESSRMVKLAHKPQLIPFSYPVGRETALPFWAGQNIDFQIVE